MSQYVKGITWELGYPQDYIETIANLYHYLMFDDRHDLWQNLGYALDKIFPGFNLHGEEPRDMAVYRRLCEILIACINEAGTGDVTVKGE